MNDRSWLPGEAKSNDRSGSGPAGCWRSDERLESAANAALRAAGVNYRVGWKADDSNQWPAAFESRTYALPSDHVARAHCRKFGLANRTPPGGWRRTERLLERAGECGLGVVADNLGNLGEGRAGVTELLSRDLHAPISEVVHRWHAD